MLEYKTERNRSPNSIEETQIFPLMMNLAIVFQGATVYSEEIINLSKMEKYVPRKTLNIRLKYFHMKTRKYTCFFKLARSSE